MAEKRGAKLGSTKTHAKGVGTLIVNNGKTPVEIDYAKLAKATIVFRALNNGKRQQIINLLESESGKLTVTDIYIKLRCEQSVASCQLAILRKAGLVKDDHVGKFVYYRTVPAVFEKAKKAISEMVG